MRLIYGYIWWRLFRTQCSLTALLWVVFFLQQCLLYVQRAHSGLMDLHTAGTLMALQMPLFFAFLLPLSFYLSVLLNYTHWFENHTYVVLANAGMSPRQWLRITAVYTAGVCLLVMGLMWGIKPIIYTRQASVLQALMRHPLKTFPVGQFVSVMGGEWVIYAARKTIEQGQVVLHAVFLAKWAPLPTQVKATASMKNVPWHEENQAVQHVSTPGHVGEWVILMAARMTQTWAATPQGWVPYFVLQHGHQYQGIPGHSDFKILDFNTYAMTAPSARLGLQTSALQSGKQQIKSLPMLALWARYRSANDQKEKHLLAAEWQWRWAVPLSVWVLMWMGWEWSQLRPRQRRYAALFGGLLSYIVYWGGILVARAWVKKGMVLPVGGIGWVHGIGLCFCILLRYVKRRRK